MRTVSFVVFMCFFMTYFTTRMCFFVSQTVMSVLLFVSQHPINRSFKYHFLNVVLTSHDIHTGFFDFSGHEIDCNNNSIVGQSC